ncbi:MAG: DUF5683 domain-containing protein [Chitinophagaceae bacterium]
MFFKAFFISSLFFIVPHFLFAQQIDSIPDTETNEIESIAQTQFPDSILHFLTSNPSPKRAAMYSALVPGLGQVYNKQYWKTGVVLLGAGVVSGFIVSNYNDYQKYQKAYIYRIDNNSNTPILYPEYTTDDVNLLRKGYRKYLEYSVLSGGALYLLTILDAYIAAHLKSFDMTKDISLKYTPTYENRQWGLKLSYCIP